MMELEVRHLSDKNQSMFHRMDRTNTVIDQKHYSQEEEGMVTAQQTTSQVKTSASRSSFSSYPI